MDELTPEAAQGELSMLAEVLRDGANRERAAYLNGWLAGRASVPESTPGTNGARPFPDPVKASPQLGD